MLGPNPNTPSSSLSLRRRTFKRDQLSVVGAPPAPHRHHAHRMTTVFSGRASQQNYSPRNSWHRHSLGSQPRRHSLLSPHRLSSAGPPIHTHIRQSSTRPPRPLSIRPFLSRVSQIPRGHASSNTAAVAGPSTPKAEERRGWRKSASFTKLRPVSTLSTLGKLNPTATLGKLRPVSTFGKLRPTSTFGRPAPASAATASQSQPASPARGVAKHAHRRTLSDGVRSLFQIMQRRPREDLMEDIEGERAELVESTPPPPLSGVSALTFSAPLRPHRSPDADSFLVTSPGPDRDTFDSPLWRTSSPSPLSPRYSTTSTGQDWRPLRASLMMRTHRRVSDLRMADRLESRFSDSSSDEDDSDDESLKIKLVPPKTTNRLSLNILRRRKGLSAPTFRGHLNFQTLSPQQRGKSCEL